eukprot:299641_1
MDITRFKLVDKDTEHLVFGYIRNIQNTLLSNNDTFCTAPVVINKICALFYFIQPDNWDAKCKSDKISVYGNIMRHTGNGNGYSTVFLSKIVNAYQHQWKFRIHKNKGCLLVGIWDNNYDANLNIDQLIGADRNTAYLFSASLARVNIHEGDYKWTEDRTYGKKLLDNDEIDMYLDFDNHTLSFSVNGKDLGKSHDIKDSEYRAVWTSGVKGNEIELLMYKMT